MLSGSRVVLIPPSAVRRLHRDQRVFLVYSKKDVRIEDDKPDMKDALLDMAARLDRIHAALYFGDPEDEEELETFATDILDISHELTSLANQLGDD